MAAEQLRLSPAKLLIVIAFAIVILVELRTVLALFGIDISVRGALVVGLVAIGALVLWAIAPVFTTDEQDDR